MGRALCFALGSAFEIGRVLSFALLLATSCGSLEPPPPPQQTVVLRVSSDPGKPLKDAVVLFSGKKIGVTDSDGAAEIKLAGRDGETFQVTVSCPKGFESPSTPIRMTFRKLAESAKKPQYDVRCPPKTRTVVVAVRAEGGADMPVTLLGREVARTDNSGAAHVVLTLETGEQFDLTLDTSNERFADLQPQNPVASFGVGQQDDIFTFDQKFEHEKKKRVFVGRAGPVQPKGPTKIEKK
jgi:hypothetical protein